MNSTFIEVTLSYPKPTKRENFTCRRNAGSFVGIVKIIVDDDTAPVTDFKCVTRDLEILTCSFKPPSFVAPILYKANYALNGNFLKVNTSECWQEWGNLLDSFYRFSYRPFPLIG